ncbi:MAG: transposase [Actinobacteria bacterium]|nr:transposase [Actinomycetota bacterium]
MSGRYQSYSDELRRRAVDEVLVRGRKASEVARELGIAAPQTLRSWVRRAEIERGMRPASKSEAVSELERLRKEVADQQRTIEILKAASTFFAQEASRHRR